MPKLEITEIARQLNRCLGPQVLDEKGREYLNEALAHAAKSECADLLVQFPRQRHTFRLVVIKLKNPRKDRKHTDTWLRLLTNVPTEN